MKITTRLFRAMGTMPILSHLRERHRHQRFLSEKGFASFHGVYTSFAEARAQLPGSTEFNQRALSDEYATRRMWRVYPYDYPVMYWLAAAFAAGSKSVFDIGGSVGVHYYGYKKFMCYPHDLAWQVCEMPEIVQVGREIAARSEASGLTFVDALAPAHIDGDVWLSAGALQYVEEGRPGRLLADCKLLPGHILLNKMPLYDGEDFVVTQNIGVGSYAPSHVYNRARLIHEIVTHGYSLIDAWDVPDRDFYLAGHSEKCFGNFSGLYFRRNPV